MRLANKQTPQAFQATLICVKTSDFLKPRNQLTCRTIHCAPSFFSKIDRQISKIKSSSKKNEAKYDTDEESEDETDSEEDNDPVDASLGPNETALGEWQEMGKILPSARLDNVAKFAFGLSKQDFETIFYESRVSLNSVLMKKKSTRVSRGDVIQILDQENEDTGVRVVRRVVVMESDSTPDARRRVNLVVWRKGISIKPE